MTVRVMRSMFSRLAFSRHLTASGVDLDVDGEWRTLVHAGKR